MDDPGGTSNTSFCSNSACHGNVFTYAGFDATGAERWRSLHGSAGDDRASSVVVGDGEVLVAGATSGALGTPAGGVDAFALTVDPTGDVTATTQLGTPQRDAADEYDEANLFAAAGPAGAAWLQGVTYGAVDGATNAGGADVFLASVPFAGNTGGGDGGTPGEGGGPGAGAGGGAGSGSGSSGAAGAGAGAVSGILGATGSEAARIAAAAALLLLSGAGLLLRRLLTRRRPLGAQ